jgi:hypothetical protein
MVQLLAIWGAVTGTIGAIVAVANFRRDRARMIVSLQCGTTVVQAKAA